jgi:hypothetical protein
MPRPTYCIAAKFTAYCWADGAAWQTLPETNTRQRSQQGSAQLGHPPSAPSRTVYDSGAGAAVSTGNLADAEMAHGAGLTSAPLRRVHYRQTGLCSL